jgi:HAD superfamily hydrolase (TIGR01490 family)
MEKERVAAFFDFDKTLLDDDSCKYGIQYLWERGRLKARWLAKLLVLHALYKRDLCSEEKMVRFLLTIYRNRRLDSFAAETEEFYRRFIVPHFAPNILSRVQEHKRQGHVLVLVSGSLRYLLEYVWRDLGFDHLFCTDLEVGPGGFLTGNPKDGLVTGEKKREVALRLAREQGIDLSMSHAYGNHHSDIPLLESVGHAHVVHPTRELEKTARKRGWEMLTFR